MLQILATFLRANAPYWFRTDTGPNYGQLFVIDFEFSRLQGMRKISGIELKKYGLPLSNESSFDCYIDEEIIVVAVHKIALISRESELLQLLKSVGREKAQAFRSSTKEKLLFALAERSSGNSTDRVLQAFCSYTRYHSYSAWLFNNITKVFTRVAGNAVTGPEFIHLDNCPVLSKVLQTEKIVCAPVDPKTWCPDKVTDSVNWCNLFYVTTDNSLPSSEAFAVVICFYSEMKDYNLRSDTFAIIRSFVQQNLANRYFNRLFGMNKLRAKLEEGRSSDDPNKFLIGACREICLHLGWESCAVYLRATDDITILRRVAPANEKAIEYPIKSDSMTSTVYRQREMLWSYDIAQDPRNTHGFDDVTNTPPRNWIGVPIMISKGEALGVMRVKNHRSVNDDADVHFNSLDMRNVRAIASEIASVLHQYEQFSIKKQLAEMRAREIAELQGFLRTFRHEIRSPIQAICFAPERIGMLLRDLGLVDATNIPRKLRDFMLDFKATGSRLEMISKALTLDPDEIVKQIEVRNLYKDCVAPVMAFMTPYAHKRRRRVLVDKDSLLANIECDSMAITMAFHVLVDNAIKYSDRDTLIRIYGEHAGGGHQVVVESRSDIFSIPDAEVNRIHQKYFRGKLAEEQKLEGSGIGLYLADRIMKLHGGQLILLNQNRPVRFALRFSKEIIP